MAASLDDVVSELKNLRADLNDGFGALRTEMKQELGAVRTEMKQELGAVRTEMKQELGAVRTETTQQLVSVRGDVKSGFASVRVELKEHFEMLHADLTVLAERVTDLESTTTTMSSIVDVLRSLEESSRAMADGLLKLTGDHEGRLQNVERILGVR